MLSGLAQWGGSTARIRWLSSCSRRWPNGSEGPCRSGHPRPTGSPTSLTRALSCMDLARSAFQGAIAGVAFETLMRAALLDYPRDRPGPPTSRLRAVMVSSTTLLPKSPAPEPGTVPAFTTTESCVTISRIVSATTMITPGTPRSCAPSWAQLLLRWLDRQSIDDQGHAVLTDVPPDPYARSSAALRPRDRSRRGRSRPHRTDPHPGSDRRIRGVWNVVGHCPGLTTLVQSLAPRSRPRQPR